GPGGGRAPRRARQGGHAVPPRLDGRAHAGPQPRGERGHRRQQHPARRADRDRVGRAPGMTGTGGRDGVQPRAGGRVVVVGDVIDDVVVRPLEAVTRDSDTRAVIARSPGGSAANLACWLGAAGAVVAFVGRVGAADGARHTEALERFGVDARLAADPDRDTGSIVILVDPDDGARTMFTDRGANLALVADDVEPG